MADLTRAKRMSLLTCSVGSLNESEISSLVVLVAPGAAIDPVNFIVKHLSKAKICALTNRVVQVISLNVVFSVSGEVVSTFGAIVECKIVGVVHWLSFRQ